MIFLWFYFLKSWLFFLEMCYLNVFYIFCNKHICFVICENCLLLLCFFFKNLNTVWFFSEHFICHFYFLWPITMSKIFTPSSFPVFNGCIFNFVFFIPCNLVGLFCQSILTLFRMCVWGVWGVGWVGGWAVGGLFVGVVGEGLPFQFFPCNFYNRRKYSQNLSGF